MTWLCTVKRMRILWYTGTNSSKGISDDTFCSTFTKRSYPLFFFFFAFPPQTFNFLKKGGIVLIFAFEAHMKHISTVPARDELTFVNVLISQNEYSLLVLPLNSCFTYETYYKSLLRGKKKKKYQSILFCLQGEFCSSARINGTIRFLIRPQCCNCCWTGFLVTCKWDFIKYRNRQICKHLQVLDPQDTRHHSFKQVCLPGQLLKISKLQAQDFILKYG